MGPVGARGVPVGARGVPVGARGLPVVRGKYYDIVVPDSRERELLYHSSSRLLGRYFEKRLDY